MDKTPIDLRATGNAVVEHRDCVAYAHQVKYDQQKDLLVLEGDGRSKVKLVERGAGDSSIVASEICTHGRTESSVSTTETRCR